MKKTNYCLPFFYTILFFFQLSFLSAQNLINNGDFEQGNGVGFSSDYNFLSLPSGSTNARDYAITKNPSPFNTSSFITMGDHTTGSGNMMIIDGINNNGNPEPFFWKVNSSGEI